MNPIWSLLGTLLLVLGLSAWLTRRLAAPGAPLQVLDLPNARSLHSRPTPRTGGLAIVVAIMAGWGLLFLQGSVASVWLGLGLGALLVTLVSFVDDRMDLHPGIRLLGHFLAAALFLFFANLPVGLSELNTHWSYATYIVVTFIILSIAWMTNLYNFMDGMDGFAAGMAVVGFSVLGLLGWQQAAHQFAAVGFVTAAAAAGFLMHNFPPARIFMGDTGSATLGFLAAGFSYWGIRDAIFPVWVPILIFSPFIVDASVTLVRRACLGERVWQAHRSHYYQRLVQLGWGHRKTVLAEYALMLLCAVSAYGMLHVPAIQQWAGLTLWGILYLTLAWAIHRREQAESTSQHD